MGMCKGCSEVYSALDMLDGFCEECIKNPKGIKDKRKDEDEYSFSYGMGSIISFFMLLLSLWGLYVVLVGVVGGGHWGEFFRNPIISFIAVPIFLYMLYFSFASLFGEKKFIKINNGTISVPSFYSNKFKSLSISTIYNIEISTYQKDETLILLSHTGKLKIEEQYLSSKDYKQLKEILNLDSI